MHYDLKINVECQEAYTHNYDSPSNELYIQNIGSLFLTQIWHEEEGAYPKEIVLPAKQLVQIKKGNYGDFGNLVLLEDIDNTFDVEYYLDETFFTDNELKPLSLRTFDTLIYPKTIKRGFPTHVFASN